MPTWGSSPSRASLRSRTPLPPSAPRISRSAEEIYVVVSGSGRIKLGDELHEIAALDAIRVEPNVVRAFEGGPDGLEVIAFGPRHDGDGELVPGFWAADA